MEVYEAVRDRFKKCFLRSRNVAYEAGNFRYRQQSQRELVDDYVPSLYRLASTCDLRGTKDCNMRRALTRQGPSDSRLSHTLQMDSSLAFETALLTARLEEAVEHQQQKLEKGDPLTSTHNLDSTHHKFRSYSSCDTVRCRSHNTPNGAVSASTTSLVLWLGMWPKAMWSQEKALL